MLLAVDVGNTEIVVGVFHSSDLEWTWRLSTRPERTPDELAILLGGLLAQRGLAFDNQVTGVVISSVVPAVTSALREMAGRYFAFPPVVVGPGTKTGMPILTDDPREVGADRVVNALAAVSRYGGPCIVVDFGTATTYDAISAKGELLGTSIAPGLQVSGSSLFSATARLPRVELAAPRHAIGRNTVEALQSGIVFGTAAEVDGIVERFIREIGGDGPEAAPQAAKVIATGGLAPVVIPHCRRIDEHDPWLTLEWLRLIFERNAGAQDG
jgi:type III pantothenate kinase